MQEHFFSKCVISLLVLYCHCNGKKPMKLNTSFHAAAMMWDFDIVTKEKERNSAETAMHTEVVVVVLLCFQHFFNWRSNIDYQFSEHAK